MHRVLFALVLLWSPAMAKDTPVIQPESKLRDVLPEHTGDEVERLLQRLDAGDESAWDDMDKLSKRGKQRHQVLEAMPKPEVR